MGLYYYYIIASLPNLDIEGGLIITIQYFLEICSAFLPEKDFQILSISSISNPDDKKVHKINKKFWIFERSLRNHLVMLRAHKIGLDANNYIKKGEDLFEFHHAAADAFMKDSPIHAEHVLNNARWDYLENLKTGHYFDLDMLIIYYLQLQILQRISCFKVDEGFKKYQSIYSDIINNLNINIAGEKI